MKIVYKLARDRRDGCEIRKAIIALGIPKRASKICSKKKSRKCRTSKAYTLAICPLVSMPERRMIRAIKIDTRYTLEQAHSRYSRWYVYKVGKCQVPEFEFEKRRDIECASGIHYFECAKSAAAYMSRPKIKIVDNTDKFKHLAKTNLRQLVDHARDEFEQLE